MLKRIILFICSNGLGTAVDTLVLWIFSTFVFHDDTAIYVIAPVISFECAVMTNYLCSYYVIWRKRVDPKSKKQFFTKFFAYNLTCSGTFLFKMLILLLIAHFFEWHVVFCNLFALCFSGIINYAMGEWVLFKKKDSTKNNE